MSGAFIGKPKYWTVKIDDGREVIVFGSHTESVETFAEDQFGPVVSVKLASVYSAEKVERRWLQSGYRPAKWS